MKKGFCSPVFKALVVEDSYTGSVKEVETLLDGNISFTPTGGNIFSILKEASDACFTPEWFSRKSPTR